MVLPARLELALFHLRNRGSEPRPLREQNGAADPNRTGIIHLRFPV